MIFKDLKIGDWFRLKYSDDIYIKTLLACEESNYNACCIINSQPQKIGCKALILSTEEIIFVINIVFPEHSYTFPVIETTDNCQDIFKCGDIVEYNDSLSNDSLSSKYLMKLNKGNYVCIFDPNRLADGFFFYKYFAPHRYNSYPIYDLTKDEKSFIYT